MNHIERAHTRIIYVGKILDDFASVVDVVDVRPGSLIGYMQRERELLEWAMKQIEYTPAYTIPLEIHQCKGRQFSARIIIDTLCSEATP